jgi:hypothetical protein
VRGKITDLKNVMTHLEHNNMLHTQVLLHKIHSLGTVVVLKGVIVVAIKAVHDITLKMLEKVDLVLQVFRKLGHRIVLPDVDGSLSPRSDIVKVAVTYFKSCKY